MMGNWRHRFIIVTLAAVPCAALADEVTDQLDLATQLYQEQDYAGAITELQFALQAIKAQASTLYVETLPSAPDGWTAQDVPVEDGAAGALGGGAQLRRSYQEDGGSGHVDFDLTVLDGDGLLSGLATMFANPAMMAAQPNVERVRVGRESAFLNWDETTRSGEVTMALAGRLMLTVKGRDLSSPDILTALVQSWDVDKAKSIAGL